jgi:uncharacterized protein (TIGR03083 family)
MPSVLALIDDLARIDDAQWERPSLCDGWTVHDVVAHMVNTNRTTRRSFAVAMIRAGFDFDRQNARGIQRARGASPAQTGVACPPVGHRCRRVVR